MFSDAANWDTLEVVVEANRRDPDPAAVNEFIEKQMNNPNKTKLLEMLK